MICEPGTEEMRSSFVVCLLLTTALLLIDNIKPAAADGDDVKRKYLIYYNYHTDDSLQVISVRPFVKTVRHMLSVRCLSVCLSVTLLNCGQTVGWIKLKLGVQVGLGLATMC